MSFIHNFENCLEKENKDNARRLQPLIQHCFGKVRDAIESCVNLPASEGYLLLRLRPLKQANGANLLKFSRHLEVANRTLLRMGSE